MPVLARVYHIPPGEPQRRLTLADFNVLRADYERQRAEEQHGDEDSARPYHW